MVCFFLHRGVKCGTFILCDVETRWVRDRFTEVPICQNNTFTASWRTIFENSAMLCHRKNFSGRFNQCKLFLGKGRSVPAVRNWLFLKNSFTLTSVLFGEPLFVFNTEILFRPQISTSSPYPWLTFVYSPGSMILNKCCHVFCLFKVSRDTYTGVNYTQTSRPNLTKRNTNDILLVCVKH